MPPWIAAPRSYLEIWLMLSVWGSAAGLYVLLLAYRRWRLRCLRREVVDLLRPASYLEVIGREWVIPDER